MVRVKAANKACQVIEQAKQIKNIIKWSPIYTITDKKNILKKILPVITICSKIKEDKNVTSHTLHFFSSICCRAGR